MKLISTTPSLVPRPIRKNRRKGPGIHCSRMRLISIRKAHVKLCKNVSNDGQYHVVMNYDVRRLLY